ncbi:MAG: hypothetical protein KDB90_14555 [Planctomycetes bacterium]|nr:hypothetical protein [Planctomycetota bacterium]
MKQWKPLIASLVVIAIAMAGLALWKSGSAPSGKGNDIAPANMPVGNADPNGLQYEQVPLEKLPELDPIGLWPRDGLRVSGVTFWTMWQTSEHAKCRLLATSDGRVWHDIGSTAGETHFLETDLAYFNGKVRIAVEFDERGTRYRSAPRTVNFGQGAHFAQREYQFTLGAGKAEWAFEIVGRSVRDLGREPCLAIGFPGDSELVPYTSLNPDSPDDSILFGVQHPEVVKEGVAGFLQVYDVVTNTYDRVLVRLKR